MRRRLDAELVRRGLAPSRAAAVDAIERGRVTVGGAPALRATRQVGDDEPIVVQGEGPRFVSRGGEKLDAALERFAVDVRGRRALDAGASTGGFTDCLLQRGAREVVAVDVGRGQLAWSLREDPRVVVLERTNVRTLALDDLGGVPVDVVVADLSFISLVVVAPALVRVATPDAVFVLLVKPQFEAGPARVGKGGIVRDPAVHRAVLGEVVPALADAGIVVTEVMPSPLRGADGNVEFVVRGARHGVPVGAARLDAVVAESHGGSA